ncbi:MAG: CBS domain-containing protein [Deltaproteobacteria bacterium]|jgi:CBS-domain-containing membrane protein|nr:CBS domain-containing protein [Deltaproteobacteria bacterium]MCL5880226.1 CBS domain-containing protein [Deltaproteobacteria bacterium]
MSEIKDKNCVEISDDDIIEAFKDIKIYIDITPEDFKEIYRHALNHAVERLNNAAIGDVMTKDVIAVLEDADIRSATDFLTERKLSGAPVIDANNIVKGFVSDADILTTAGMAKDHTFRDIIRHLTGEPIPRHLKMNGAKTIKDIMTSPAIAATPEMDVKKAAEILMKKGIKKMPVVDKEGRLVGIVSVSDIIKNMGKRGKTWELNA